MDARPLRARSRSEDAAQRRALPRVSFSSR
jgi:hypothetical protein